MAVVLPWSHRRPNPAPARGASASEGDYAVSLGELIASPANAVYEVLELLGRGTFGQVLRCWRRDSSEVVALKVLKNLPSYAKQGQVEIDVLTRLSKVNADEFNFVRAYESFQHRGHICIAFELLQINLYDYLKRTHFTPLPLHHVRPIAQQVLVCLEKLRELGLVHADLKPENIMLVDPDRRPFRIKVIDFGSTTPRSKQPASTYLQSRYYRAPEVILGLSYAEAIDMWSLGCVLAELCLGWPLFPGVSEFDQITFICQTIGPPTVPMLRGSGKSARFFARDGATGGWALKSQQQYELETGIKSRETRKFILASLTDIAQACNHSNDYISKLDCQQFVSLLVSMLTFDPSRRLVPAQALQHPFLTMQHLAMHTGTQSVREWIQSMQVCCHAKTTGAPPGPAPSPAHLLPSQPHYLHPSHLLLHHQQLQQTHPPPAQLPQPPAQLPPLAYHVAPSTLAYLPSPTDRLHHEPAHVSWNEVDIGYVSGDSSPAILSLQQQQQPQPPHEGLDAKAAAFLAELPPATLVHPVHPLTLHPLTPHHSLYALSSPQYLLPLGYPASFMRDCAHPTNPFCRL